MNLKQHNDIVQRLLQQIQSKDKEITLLNKQLSSKTSNQNQNKTIKPQQQIQTQKLIEKRISQLNKQHNTKLQQLNQEIKNLQQQNTELKERLSLKINIDAKEKERIVQVMKKNGIERKPGSKQDHKITLLINHYEGQLTKKAGFIETLKRQIKSLSMNFKEQGIKEIKKAQIITINLQQQQVQQQFQEQAQKEQDFGQRTISLVQYNKAMQKAQLQSQAIQRGFQKKNNQLKDLRQKYNQLTKEYYRVINEYGLSLKIDENTEHNKKVIKQKESNPKRSIRNNVSNNSGLNSKELSFALSEQESSFNNQEDRISNDLEQNFINFNSDPKKYQSQNQSISKTTQFQRQSQSSPGTQQPQLEDLITQILQVLNITSSQQILPTLTRLATKQQFESINEQVLKSLHELMYFLGMGKVSRKQMTQVLQAFKTKCQKWMESSDLLDQLCIEVGAKRQKLLQKINYYKKTQVELIDKVKSFQFMGSINKSSKVLQFIDFFELDRTELELPQQLKNIYKQLKYVDRFIKQANSTLGFELKDRKGLQQTLEFILRKLQKYHVWQVQLEKENQRKINHKMQKSKVVSS